MARLVGTWVLLSAGIFAVPARSATPPEGFVDLVAIPAASVSAPTGIAYEPGSGALFVLEKGSGGSARVLRRDPRSGGLATALTVPCVDSAGERGLLGIAFDPDYADPSGESRFAYLYYTRSVGATGSACALPGVPAGSRNRVARYRESGGALSAEEVLLEGPVLGPTNHNGGTVRFLPDGTLLISMGDNDSDASPNPYSRDLSDLRGKMLRIARDGSVPADNPFVGRTGVRPEVWAWGLRNPFRFSVDQATGTPYIADVGEGTWEEIDAGAPGADYGYPCFEGPAPFRSCEPPPPEGSAVAPIYAYGHGTQTAPVQGASVTGGPVYRGTAFPTEYRGDYFFGDFVAGWIRRAAIGSDGKLTDITMFLPDAGGVVDMALSPRGCLAWVSINGGGVRETCYGPSLADADGSGRVDGFDLARLGRAFGAVCNDLRFDETVDFDRDCAVDGGDLSVLAAAFGRSIP